ncbi:MAG: 1-acyl-sn-glycerol-3-phosphate acyltransferase [Desulfobulbaceae bacterium]|jgi:1-acyl-sn-glycerol-3-phosphate acyltransferase|nr:1-acyl-sn-glycerol-3-phosphate acyltransferase [Desulfobulbaceae bacterium]
MEAFDYQTEIKPGLFGRALPSLYFYSRFLPIVAWASWQAKRDAYHGREWVESSGNALRSLEGAGVRFQVSGLDHFRGLTTPCVCIADHMSMLETITLPYFMQPIRPITYVIKESLLRYPVFKYVMRSCNPVAVGRVNPRQDLKTVLEQGGQRLASGVSVIIFPQTTRSRVFDPEQMTTIGVKLAKAAGVPALPLALKTDAMENGRIIKELGKINPERTVHFAFAPPLTISGTGREEHQAINAFILEKLDAWGVPRLTS